MLTLRQRFWIRTTTVYLVHLRYAFSENPSPWLTPFRTKDCYLPRIAPLQIYLEGPRWLWVNQTAPLSVLSREWISAIGFPKHFAYARLLWTSISNQSIQFVTNSNSHSLFHLLTLPDPPLLSMISQTHGQLVSQGSMRVIACCIRRDGSTTI